MSSKGIIFENVRVEMARKEKNIADVARATGIHYETLLRKLHGKSRITLEEALKIQQSCFPDTDVHTLFKEYDAG